MTPPTPLEPAPGEIAGARSDVFLKREDVHALGAFKWRGALPVIEAYRDAGAVAVVTASTGNYGAATAWAASRAGVRAIVFAPPGAARAKLELIERHGAEIRLTGSDFDQAKAAAAAFAADEGPPLFEDGASGPVPGLPGVAAESWPSSRRRPQRWSSRSATARSSAASAWSSASTRRPRSESESSRRKPR